MDLIAYSSSVKRLNEDTNLFEFFKNQQQVLSEETVQKVFKDLHTKEEGFFIYKDGQIQVLMCYEPLDIQDWFLFSSMPLNIVTKHYKNHSLFFVTLCIAIIVGFSFVIISVINRGGEYRNSLELALYIDPITGGMSHSKFEKPFGKLFSKLLLIHIHLYL